MRPSSGPCGVAGLCGALPPGALLRLVWCGVVVARLHDWRKLPSGPGCSIRLGLGASLLEAQDNMCLGCFSFWGTAQVSLWPPDHSRLLQHLSEDCWGRDRAWTKSDA